VKKLSVLAMLYLAHLAIGCAPPVTDETEPSYVYGESKEKAAFLANRDSIVNALWRDGFGENVALPQITWEQPDPGCPGGRIYSRDLALGCVYGVRGIDGTIRISIEDPWSIAHELTHASLVMHENYYGHGERFDAVHLPAVAKLWSLTQEAAK
jgi:hypothetical protein